MADFPLEGSSLSAEAGLARALQDQLFLARPLRSRVGLSATSGAHPRSPRSETGSVRKVRMGGMIRLETLIELKF